ncbi:DUF354 domain-containing protein [Pseudotenacibaculum haliotis]|uniref:DUF354 domain-containing protein n=1 Tax=Pseudotenacibaculum haliotis TaxID=1862138 RepID=A0ABW5LTD9_9FLAO
MKILVDVAHPANVHYFKNFIFEMKNKGHEVHITARDKDVSFLLLEELGLPYYNMGKGNLGKGIIGKILYVIYADFLMFKQFIKFKPDIVVSFSSSYAAHNCFLFRKPHITFEDTEHATANMLLYKPFTNMILTPLSFYKDMGKNHFKFKGFMELFYLHKKRFIPNPDLMKSLGIDISKPFVLFRYVSWGAFHDIGQKGLSIEDKISLISEAEKYANVYISSEGELPEELKKYQLKIKANDIHHVLAYTSLYVGEGGTMASECAMLGTPSIYVNSLPLMGYLKDANDHDLLHHLSSYEEIKERMVSILKKQKEVPNYYKSQRDKFLEGKIEPNSFLIWLIESYPKSKEILKESPDYQNKFI